MHFLTSLIADEVSDAPEGPLAKTLMRSTRPDVTACFKASAETPNEKRSTADREGDEPERLAREAALAERVEDVRARARGVGADGERRERVQLLPRGGDEVAVAQNLRRVVACI